MSQPRPGAVPVSTAREAAARLLRLPDLAVVDVVLATLVANQIVGDPVWLVLVSPPSNGKTELLTAAAGTPKTFLLSTLTKRTLISGQRPVEAAPVGAAGTAGAGERPEPSLLPRLTGQTLVLKDFGSILGLHRDDLAEILGQLREVYDGKVVKSFGTGKTFTWEGKMGLIAGVTPVFDRHLAVQAILGERFLLYRIPTGDREERRAQAQMALRAAGGERDLRDDLAKAMGKSYAAAVGWWQKNREGVTVPAGVEGALVALADLAAHGRAGVLRDHDHAVRYWPEPEGPARLVKQLRQLLLGLTVIHGKLRADDEELAILRQVVRATMHPFRARVLAALAERDRTVADLAKAAGLPYTTARRELEECAFLETAEEDPASAAASARERVWRLRPEVQEDIAVSGIFADLAGQQADWTLSPAKPPPRGREGKREEGMSVGGGIAGYTAGGVRPTVEVLDGPGEGGALDRSGRLPRGTLLRDVAPFDGDREPTDAPEVEVLRRVIWGGQAGGR